MITLYFRAYEVWDKTASFEFAVLGPSGIPSDNDSLIRVVFCHGDVAAIATTIPLIEGEGSFMALGTSLSLSTDTPTDVDTNLRVYVNRFVDSDNSEYSVAGLTLPNQQLLRRADTVGKGGEQRKLTRLDETVVDAFGVAATASVYLNIVRPPNTAVTNTVIKKLVYQLIDLLIEGGAGANIDAILNGEM